MQASSARGQVETQLLAHVKHLERNYFEWQVVHLHLSQLQAQNRRHYQLKLAASEFDGPLRQLKSELFQISNGDIFFFWHCASVAEVDPVVLRLRYLFSDDPLTSDLGPAPDDGGELSYDHEAMQGSGRLCTWYDLSREYDSFRYGLEELLATLAPDDAAAGAAASLEPLDPARLGRIETSLASMDLSKLLRRQAVCAVLPHSAPQPLFTEVYVAIRELAQLLVPGVDLLGDTWLFQRLAASLDRRLLACLSKREEGTPAGPISLNLRLATLLSPDFLNFHHEYRENGSGSVVVELQLVDIFAELGAYLFLREFLRERGYLVCIDGLHDLHLPLIDRKQLGADLVKLSWSPDLLDGVNEAARSAAGGDQAHRVRPGHPLPLRQRRGDQLGPVDGDPAVPGLLPRFPAARCPAAGGRRRAPSNARYPRVLTPCEDITGRWRAPVHPGEADSAAFKMA